MQTIVFRQGDVLAVVVDALPEGCQKVDVQEIILAYGEVTGHSHRIADPTTAELFRGLDGLTYLKVIADEAVLVHDEHAPIVLPRGVFRVNIQREYHPEAIRPVAD